MPEARGFLDTIGVGAQDEASARIAQRNAQLGGNDFAGRQFLLGQQASPLVSGLAGAAGGVLQGDLNVVDNARAGAQRRNEELDAISAGISVEKLRSNKEIREATADFKDDGSFESRIALAKQVAAIANRNGDLETAANALRQVTEIEAEQKEFEKLGVEVRSDTFDQNVEEEVGVEARHINDQPNQVGKAIRINDGPDAGKFLLIRPGEDDQVVRGGDLIIPGVTRPKVTARVQDSLQGLARANGATAGNIVKMRGTMASIADNANIVSSIMDNFANITDPQALLSGSGTVQIAADKAVSLVESISTLFKPAGVPETKIEWNGKPVSAARQHQLATEGATSEDGILSRYLSEEGLSLDDALPQELRGNALAAEQYWANVMELSYLDARIQEPANRGLSDNDIKNALKRIGADTANPVSFAVRQKQVIENKLLPQLQNLGSDFSNFASERFSAQDIADTVFPPQKKAEVEQALFAALENIDKIIQGGRRGAGDASTNDGQGAPTQAGPRTLEQIDADIAALEAELAGGN